MAIRVVDKSGMILGEIPTPGNTNTTAFGGPNKKLLYAIQTRPRRKTPGSSPSLCRRPSVGNRNVAP